MKQLSDAEVLARFDEVLDSVVDDREEVVITRAERTPVVMVALDDYEALQETVHLLRSPANANGLLDAMARLDANAPRQKNFLLALREVATEVSGVDVTIAPRDSQASPLDVS
jgi:antitoxin YefM